ncbi:dnaJ homolog subfamily C member 9 [Corythoichthys intestinalis]|uniref:dnaJ homolog subfamily C member 9 n=1 Tax=Corythoichthys intestinalis TaxID=161448 RepID=UPI0025A5353D|nr:dnaJ homolog subfamily C member 9 [Corythoichthys intestinalis]XP_061794739.1 dnaJ homolog subfamily C member 9 [Nerophis lumbriciformis]
MGLLDRCQELFRTANLYEVLGINNEATEAEIRRGYYKASLKVHPDRAPDDPLATEKFQVLSKLYAILIDKEQRAIYDEQGVVDEESDILSKDSCWEDYWRQLFPKITVQDILEFEKKYKGSDEERKDLLQLYTQHQGDMDTILTSLLCGSQDDEPRLGDIIRTAIKDGEVEEFPAFTQESDKKKRARRKRADRERKEAEEMQKEMGLNEDDDSLTMMIKQKHASREKNFNSFLSDLEAKYCKKGGKSSKRGKK